MGSARMDMLAEKQAEGRPGRAVERPTAVAALTMAQALSTAPGTTFCLRLSTLIAAAVLASASVAAEYTGRVVGVLDGDTIDVLTVEKRVLRVRLSGIDAPERRQPFAAASKRALSDLVFKKQVLVQGDKYDRYGRFVGKVLASGRDVNLAMVEQGFAWHYKVYAVEQSEADQAAYGAAEAMAKERGLGLWGDSNPGAPWEFRRQRRRVGMMP